MTNTELNKSLASPSTVVELVDHDKQYARLTSTKHLLTFDVYKPRYNYNFFRVKVNKGSLPQALSGDYSSLTKAINAVTHYLNTTPETQGAKNERLHKERQERNAARADSTNSK